MIFAVWLLTELTKILLPNYKLTLKHDYIFPDN